MKQASIKFQITQESRTFSVRSYICASAFTLIELMISIALVVLLILGVSQVFQYTTQAVGAGEAVTAAIRNSRSVQSTFDSDFAAMVGTGTGNNDAASLIISSRAVYAFRDAKDQSSQGTSYSPQTGIPATLPPAAFRDLNSDGTFGDPTVNGEIILPDNYNYRNHRLDTLSFFARNTFSRQTGNIGTVVDPLNSPEAWIWYGHLWLPNNYSPYDSVLSYPFALYQAPTTYPLGTTGPLTFPGAGSSSTNPNNYYANQWVLGRQAVVLKEKDSTNTIYDNNGLPQLFINHTANYIPYSFPTSGIAEPIFVGESDIDPLCSSSLSTVLQPNDPLFYMQDSRYDLASTSISAFRNKLGSYLDIINSVGANTQTTRPNWYDWLMDGNINPPAGRNFPLNPTNGDRSYTRFRCNPFLTKPFSADKLAEASPYFQGGCSQFIVEFAGDFLTQDNNPAHIGRAGFSQYGDVIGAGPAPDGQLDFFINAQGAKQTIWYGMPRNTSGQATTCAGTGSTMMHGNPPIANSNYLNPNGDVVPLRDWLQYTFKTDGSVVNTPLPTPPGIHASFEQFDLYNPLKYQPNDYNAYMTLAEAQNGYTCAWSPTDIHPKIMLIRITITLEDPTGRLPEGQTFQYVFPVAPAATSK